MTGDARSLISVIVIFLNAARYIEEALESIMAQTYADWELLLVDDGSTDDSSRIARSYETRMAARIKYLEHTGHRNRGMSASRNLGLAHTRGAFVGFLDADDVWAPTKLADQLAAFSAHPEAGMVYGRTLIWHSWTGRPADARRDHVYDLGVPADTLVLPPRLFHVLLQNRAQTPTTCNALIRREVFDVVGGFEDGFRGLYEDQAFFAKVNLRVPVYVADACWAKYRQHAESCSAITARRGGSAVSRRPLLEWLARYIDDQGFDRASDVRQAVQRALAEARHPTLSALRRQVFRWARRTRSAGGDRR